MPKRPSRSSKSPEWEGPWLAHDRPDLGLMPGAQLCCCTRCADALLHEAKRLPDLAIGLKFYFAGRLLFPAWQVVEARAVGGWDELSPQDDDAVREAHVLFWRVPGHEDRKVPESIDWPSCPKCSASQPADGPPC
jgi:hypothetical protein